MKRKLFTIAIALCMVFTMIPAGVFQIETAWADTDVTGNVTSVQIAGKTLNESTGLYYYNGADGAAGTVSDQSTLNGETPNATFDPSTGTLTLNELNVNAETGIVWNYSHSSSKTHNLVIKLEGSTNIINSGSTSAINGKSGYPNDGPSLTIIGSGTLTLNGSYGIWVWHDITIGGNVVVNATGSTGGIYNNDSYGKIVIQDKAIVTAEGKTEYGIKADNTNASTVEIKGGTLELKGSTAAMKTAPTFYPAKYSVTASTNSDGSGAVSYDESAFSTYKYLKFTKADTENVGIYLRFLDTKSNIIKNVKAPEQLNKLGLGTSYCNRDSYGDWVAYGSFESANAETYNHQPQDRDSDGVKAVIDEMKQSTVTINSGITFSNLDALTWDTLSWSDDGRTYSWHLNGAIVLCKVDFDLNYPDDATGKATKPATRYAIKGTAINTGLPTNPSCDNYTFDGWYLSEDGADEITQIPELDNDVTYYAHWTAKSSQGYNVTITAGEGMSLTSGDATQTGLTGAMTDVVYTADAEHYFPEDYAVNQDGIKVTRNSYTQITVSGEPTANTEITLPAATQKTKKATPNATFTANGSDSGQLTNVTAGMKYQIAGQESWHDIADTTADVMGISACTIKVVKKGTDTTLDSDPQEITVTQAETPNLVCTQPNAQNPKGIIPTTAIHEIGTSTDSYTPCSGESQVDPGTYYVRVRANGQTLASSPQTIEIEAYVPPQFTITFNANGGHFGTSSDEEFAMTVTSGDVINAPANVTKDKDKKYTYSFDGWYTAKEGGEEFATGTTAIGNATYYAHWEKTLIEYNITYDPNGGEMTGNDKQTYTWVDGTIALNASATKQGYKFLGWATEVSGTPIETLTITDENLGDLTFYAQWEALPAVKPTVSLDKESLTINAGSRAVLTATATADAETEYTLTYQWYSNTTESNEGGAVIEGATEATLNIPADTAVGTYYYYCVVTAKRNDNGQEALATTNVATVTVNKKTTSSGGGSYIQKPTIVTDEGANASLSYSGSNLTITAKDGYEITDVLVNGVSKGAVAEITGLKTGDKVEVKTAKKAEPTEPTDPAADSNAKLIKGVENTTIVLKSKLTKNKNVLLTWTKSKGYKVDKFEFYRSVKKNSGYGKAAFFTTKDGSWSKYLNTKDLKAGKTYYYKVRGVRVIDGQKYYTQWTNKAWRTIK